ncbi:MAG: hypothetical protein INR65_12775 [Gluconacetobacter diazotrophicus]|nr:hypothetical protein [Gluconacetobacter diazotrophicus]
MNRILRPVLSRRVLLGAGVGVVAERLLTRGRPAAAAADALAALHVMPGPATTTPTGTGTAADPFQLGRGGEYALNRLVRGFMDAGQALDVRFGDGVYQDVRLQILREGIDRQAISLRERGPTGAISYLDAASCNAAGANCRVADADFAIGPSRCAPLVLRAENPGGAVFDGSGLGGGPAIDDTALVISGAVFGSPGEACTDSASPRISDVLVSGLSFRNYRDGIQVTYAEQVVVACCSLDAIGDRAPRNGDPALLGTFAFRVDGDSRDVLVRDCAANAVWNRADPADGADGAADPSLVHAVYQGYARDVVFANNSFDGCSGPMVKFGDYPSFAADEMTVACVYPTEPRHRCTVFLGNRFVLSPLNDDNRPVPVFAPEQCFIEENSMEAVPGGISAPAGGAIFIDNAFENRLAPDPDTPVIFLRQELPPPVGQPHLPGWSFNGNTITGVDPANLLATRQRGTPLEASSIVRVDAFGALRAELEREAAADAAKLAADQVASTLAAALAAVPGSRDDGQDTLLVRIAISGTMPWMTALADSLG